MLIHPANPFVRAIRVAPVVACLFAGCTCAGKPAPAPTPSSTVRPAATPTPVARQTDTPPPTIATVETPPAAAPAPPTPDAAKGAACKGYVAVLSGRKQDPAVLDNPDLRALAAQSPDLVTCGAVLSNSDVLCNRLMPTEHGPGKMCSQMRAIFYELRTYPQGRSFLFADVDWQEWQPIHVLAPPAVDAFRDAMRAGDAKKCAQTGDLQSICSAYVNLDKSLCRVQGKLAEAEIAPPERKEGEPPKVKLKDALEESCRQTIESRAFLAKGLKALAASGPPRERELAKAALQQADACEMYAQAALQSCAVAAPPQVPGAADAKAPVPAPPLAGAPVSAGKSPPTGSTPPDTQGSP